MQQINASPEGHLVTVKEVAERLRISSRQVWKLLSSDRLPPPVRIGGSRSVRWRSADISRYIDLGCPNREQFEAALIEGKAGR